MALFRSCATASLTSGNTLRFSSISLFGRSGRYASRTATVWIAYYAFATIVVLAVARAASAAAFGGLDRALRVSSGFVGRYPNVEVLANRYHPALRRAVSMIIAIVAVLVLLEAWGVDALAWF